MYIYKAQRSKFIFLVLYVDDILFDTNALGLLDETKKFLSKNFVMKDMGKATYMIIKIFLDRSQGFLGLSQKACINKIERDLILINVQQLFFDIQKGDKINLMQYLKNELERDQIESIPYASIVGSLMCAQTCTRPDITFVIGMLGMYQSNPRLDH